MNAFAKLSIVSALVLTACAHAPEDTGTSEGAALTTKGALPVGHYDGTGKLSNPDVLAYHVEYDVKVDEVVISWGSKILDLNLTWQSDLAFSFVVVGDESDSGNGYCLDGRCHFASPTGAFEMTLAFSDDGVVGVGSLALPNGRMLWSESLVRR